MNNTFSLPRTWLLLKKFTKEHLSTHLLYIASMFGIMCLVYGFAILTFLNSQFEDEAPQIFYIFGMLGFSTIFAGNFYSFFQNKAKGIQFLNLPASNGEKLVIGFLFTQIVFFAVFITMFVLVDRLMGAAYDKFHVMPKGVSPENYDRYKSVPINITGSFEIGGLILAFVLSSILHFGSLCFEKQAFFKTALIVLASSVIIIYVNYTLAGGMISEDNEPGGMFYTSSLRLGTDSETKGVVLLPKSWDNFVYWFLPGMIYVLFWTASYFKLKEKQV